MSIRDAVRNYLSGATSSIQGLRQVETGLLATRAELDQEEYVIINAPAPKSELTAAVVQLVRAEGQRWLKDWAREAILTLGGRIERSVGPADNRAPDVLHPGKLPDRTRAATAFTMMAALDPDRLAKALSQAITALEYEAGPPMAGRLPRLSAIQRERLNVAEQHRALVDEAAAAGIVLAHLPEEVARRARDTARQAAYEADARLNAAAYARRPELRPGTVVTGTLQAPAPAAATAEGGESA